MNVAFSSLQLYGGDGGVSSGTGGNVDISGGLGYSTGLGGSLNLTSGTGDISGDINLTISSGTTDTGTINFLGPLPPSSIRDIVPGFFYGFP